MKIISINCSLEKGKKKKPVEKGVLVRGKGLVNDFHFGRNIGKDISALFLEDIEEFERKLLKSKIKIKPGSFAENLTLSGRAEGKIKIGDKYFCKDIILEVSEIGKNCYEYCPINKLSGKCPIPERSFFFKVISGGEIRKGEILEKSE